MINLIKNYLPLRVRVPSPNDPSKFEDTFLFVKQHIPPGHFAASKTLFVANAPFYPNVRTSILLKHLFERYGDVDKVIVAHNPRKHVDHDDDDDDDNDDNGENNHHNGSDHMNNDMTANIFKKEIQSMGNNQSSITLNEQTWYDQGKFAHVVFSTSKTFNKVWKQINGKNSEGVIKFGKLEMQELEDISNDLFKKEKKRAEMQFKGGDYVDENNYNEEEEEEEHHERKSGLASLVEAKRASIPSRETLKIACERIMAKYEEAEEAAHQQQLAAKNQPDDDGFITVSYSTNVGDVVDMEESGFLGSTGTYEHKRRNEAMKRNRSARQNVIKGSDELKDFYRFQLKENKKRSMDELKNRFQEDLKRVKKMKEDKMFRPF